MAKRNQDSESAPQSQILHEPLKNETSGQESPRPGGARQSGEEVERASEAATIGCAMPNATSAAKRVATPAPPITSEAAIKAGEVRLLEPRWLIISSRALPNELLHVTPPRRYLLISPCRDEAQYLRRTLDSVAAQSVPPALWVVVDDGSTRRDPGHPGGICPSTALPARGAACRSRPPAGGAGRHRGLLRRPGDGAPGGVRIPVQAGHGSGPAGAVLRAADAADGERSARSGPPPASRGSSTRRAARWCRRSAATRCRWA